MEIGYKVVRPIQGKLYSCRVHPKRGNQYAYLALEYGVGRVTRVQGTPMLVFTTEDTARRFANNGGGEIVQVANEKEHVYLCAYEPAPPFMNMDQGSWPAGTDFASECVLIKEIISPLLRRR